MPCADNFNFCRHAVFPLHIQCSTAGNFHSAHASAFPRFRQRTQQMQRSAEILHNRFRHSCRRSEIAVYLKNSRRMQIKQRNRCKFLYARIKMFPHLFALSEPCIKACRPRTAPAGMCAALRKPIFQRLFRRRILHRSFRRTEQIRGIKSVQMRQMPMPRFNLRILPVPFEQPAATAYLKLRQIISHFSPCFNIFLIGFQNLGGFYGISEQIVCKLNVHSR